MALVDTINNIKEHINDAYGIVEEKGGTIPQNKNLENLSDSIGSISGGGETSNYLISDFSSEIQPTAISSNFLTFFKSLPDGYIDLINKNNITSFMYGFAYLKNIDDLDLRKLNISNSVKWGLSSLFQGCSSLKNINVSGWKIPTKVNYFNHMFSFCSSLSEIDLSTWDMTEANISQTIYMFRDCALLETIKLPDLTNDSLKTVNYMFQNCSILKNVDLSKLNTVNVTDMSYMFYGCKMLDIDFNLDTTNVTNMNSMFYDCMVEMPDKTMKLKYQNTKVTNMSAMFRRSTGYTTFHGDTKLDLSEFYTPSVTNMSYMFWNYGDKKLDLRSFDTSKVTNMGNMFNSCKFLEELYIDNFDFTKVTTQSSMFTDCGTKTTSKLTKVYVKDATAQNWILTKSNGRPSTWSTANVIIAGSTDDDRNL